MFDRRLLLNFDWILCILILALCAFGIMAIHSATLDSPRMAHFQYRQMYWIFLGLLLALATTLIDYRTLARWGYFFHGVVIIFLVLVLLFGVGGPGSPVERWLKIGPIFFQPSEFAKYSLVMVLAHYFREGRRIGNIGLFELFIPLTFVVVPFLLIAKQPDLGTAMLVLFTFIPIIFMIGLKVRTMLFFVIIAAFALPMTWNILLKPYQKDRVLTFMDPDRDPLGTGYHVIQSKIAVGSGGMFGKGFEQGTQGKLNFLPAHHTDFIFSVYSEEWGFIGSSVLLLLFLFMILWSLTNVLKVKDRTSAILTVGIVSIFTAQILVNIGMVLGLMPVVGVPLPFVSYGGSAMLSNMFGVGLLLNMRMRRYQFV